MLKHCPDCKSLTEFIREGDRLVCDVCGYSEKAGEFYRV